VRVSVLRQDRASRTGRSLLRGDVPRMRVTDDPSGVIACG
jgi:hypothetical protein